MSDPITLDICDPHPSCEGHFPGAPVLPAVALLDEVLHALEGATGLPLTVASAKFLAPIRPGHTLLLSHAAAAGGALRFTLQHAGSTVASGVLRPAVR
jgi:3-hydroxymyristoyl/3-hydroxydecanoyl-(acyl carrier protein) dehydratase